MPHSWNATAANQVPSLFTVLDAESQGDLIFSGSAPTAGDFPAPPGGAHAQGYCFTRQDFEDWIGHSDMSASGIALGQLMSKSDMETYRVLASATITDAESIIAGGANFQARAEYSVGSGTNSVVVAESLNGGVFQPLQTANVTPGSTGNLTSFSTAQPIGVGNTVQLRITPFSGANGTGSAGTAVLTGQLTEPP